MNSLVLTFDPTGSARCLYSELLDLGQLGRLDISRASTIEFNNASQVWEVKNPKGAVLFFSKFRSACLAWEQDNIEPIGKPLATPTNYE